MKLEIKTEYNVGDVVFMVAPGRLCPPGVAVPVKGKVVSVHTRFRKVHDETSSETVYWVEFDLRNITSHESYGEGELYHTFKEAMGKSLEKMHGEATNGQDSID